MREKLIIKNFGPIKSVELELSRFNILIGEQATGKSTIAKLLAVCRFFSYIIGKGPVVDNSDNPFYEGLIAWGLHEAVKKDSYIYYECRHYSLTVEQSRVRLLNDEDKEIVEEEWLVFVPALKPISKEFTKLLHELDKIKPGTNELHYDIIDWEIPYSFFQNDVARVMDNPFYLPAERGLQSIFSLGKSSIQNISDSLFNQLAKIDQIARNFKEDTPIEPLGIVYKNVDGRGYIRKSNETEFYSLFNAASGYKAAIPIVLATKYYNEFRKRSKTFNIEETELDLFPAAQQKLMQYLVDNILNYGNSLLMETHSPYSLTSLNNLMYAYQVGQKEANKSDAIISKKFWLNPEYVSAYMMLPDGTCEDILDRTEGLIKAEKIDEVSRVINDQFDSLLNVEFGNKNESDK